MRTAILGIAGAVVIGIGAGVAYLALQPGNGAGGGGGSKWLVNSAGADIGGPFTLTTHEGERVTAEEVIDGPTLIYFGYTWCPDVCPVDTQNMIDAVNRLEERGIEVDPVFITVDPARDDVQALSDYVEAFHPRMVGLTGSMESIRSAAEAYKVYFSSQKSEPDEEDYLVDHTAFTYLMTPDGLAAMFRNATPPDVMADEVARILEQRGVIG